MKAQIFYLKGSQEKLLEDLTSLLRAQLYRDISVEPMPVLNRDPEKAGGRAAETARAYVNLLKSSMVRVDDFRISVEDPDGSPWYMGYDAHYSVIIKKSLLPSVFPAVAVMGRMVMLPQEIQEVLDCPKGFTFFPKPLDVEGVALVDFRDPKSMLNAARQVAAQLRDDIAKLCRRYMFVNRIQQPEFDDNLVAMLGVDKDYLELHRDVILTPSVELVPKVVSGPLRLGHRSRVVLEISKPPDKALGEVRVRVTGPSDTLAAPVVSYLDFSAGHPAAQRVGFEVTACTHPFCPVEVLFEPSDMAEDCTPFPIPVMLDVTRD